MSEVAEKPAETEEQVRNKGGRPKGSPNKEEYAIVVWQYTLNQYREDYDVEKDCVVLKEVEDFEKKKYKERVRFALVRNDNCFQWESERNDKLARAAKKNRIRVVNWYSEEKDDEKDVIGEKDGVKFAVQNAGDNNG